MLFVSPIKHFVLMSKASYQLEPVLEGGSLGVEGIPWQEVRPLWLDSCRIFRQTRAAYTRLCISLTTLKTSIRISRMAYFSLDPHTTPELYGTIKQCFFFFFPSCSFVGQVVLPLHVFPSLPPSQRGTVGDPCKKKTRAYIVYSDTTHMRREVAFQLFTHVCGVRV